MNARDLQRLRRAVRTGAPVYVEWVDSMGYHSGWLDHDDIKPGLPVMRSIGFAIAVQDDVKVSLAGHLDTENGHCNGILDIPLVAITAVRMVTV